MKLFPARQKLSSRVTRRNDQAPPRTPIATPTTTPTVPAAPAPPEPADWFSFDHPHTADTTVLRPLLGGKGAGLVDMVRLGIPVPPGFTIPTTVCLDYLDSGWTESMRLAVLAGLERLEADLGRRVGDPDAPLLLSIRSGAAISMPGMMDTVLNAGMTVEVARGLEQASGDPAFAWGTFERAATSYAEIVLGADPAVLAELRTAAADGDPRVAALAYAELVGNAGFEVPDDPVEQIMGAVRAVFASWNSDRAASYRKRQRIADDIGTAATIQAMVFGNMGDTSGTGVAFSRDPSTGEYGLTGDFMVNAQGEDVVAGTHQTMPIAELGDRWPALWDELRRVADTLESQCQDMVDLEFTIENGSLWLLQTRVAKRSPRATFRSALDMAESDAFPDIDRAAAIDRCRELLADPPMACDSSAADDDTDLVVLGTGLAASPGLVVGVLSTDPDDAVSRQERGERVILAREETSPNDVHGMGASVGLVTTLGGMVSHAAVVARAWGLAAVVGCDGLSFDDGALLAGDRRVEPGSVVSVCGDTGRVFLGAKSGATTPLPEVETIQQWVREAEEESAALHAEASDIEPIAALRLIELKGMTTADTIAEPLAASAGAVQTVVDALVAERQVEALAGGRLRTTDTGDASLAALLAAERATAESVCDAVLEPFHAPNLTLKELVTAWQLREVDGQQQPNDHTDADYDASVIDRLRRDVHAPIGPILGDVAAILPRFQAYQRRLDAALARLDEGDARYMAHPVLDSYHTIWFELHEELIRVSGRDRKTEAEAGRA